MKPNKQSRGKQAAAWITPLLISCGIIFGSAFILGPLLSDTVVSRKIVTVYHCPGAVETTEERGPVEQVGSDPNAFGQSVRVVCTFPDGSTKVVSNDENAITTILGSLSVGAMIGVVIVIIFIPLYFSQKKKTQKNHN